MALSACIFDTLCNDPKLVLCRVTTDTGMNPRRALRCLDERGRDHIVCSVVRRFALAPCRAIATKVLR